ncbi:MAG: Fic family protein [Actinomycetia bacterium]|nr:Fic family protein [Actinomycetes bacterium]
MSDNQPRDSGDRRVRTQRAGGSEINRGTWPALDYETVAWDVNPVSGMTRRETRWIGRPYAAAIVPEIAGHELLLDSATMADAEEAAAELVRFDAEVGHMPGSYSAVLLRSEAMSSSRIENITASARAIVEAEITGAGKGNGALVASNAAAMRRALSVPGRLDESRILAMHEVLMRGSHPEIAGRFRDDQVWIGSDNVPHTADFVPPVAGRVRPAISDLTSFLDRNDLPVVVQAAISHAQFETIHPFADGNGRTGRTLLHAVLAEKGLSNSSAPVSTGFLVRKAEYVAALTAYRAGDPLPIIEETSRAVILAAREGRVLVTATRDVRERWRQAMSRVRSDSAAHRLADGIVSHPVITVHEARAILGSDQNVHRHIDALVEHGVLKPHQEHRTRLMTWRAQDVLDELDAFAERMGRRAR